MKRSIIEFIDELNVELDNIKFLEQAGFGYTAWGFLW
jgi:hypothetical protein